MGVTLDSRVAMHIATKNQRSTERRPVALPARLTWKDQRGTTRFATVVARNVSDFGVYVECQAPVSIPLYRLAAIPAEHEAGRLGVMAGGGRPGRLLSAGGLGLPSPPAQAPGVAAALLVAS